MKEAQSCLHCGGNHEAQSCLHRGGNHEGGAKLSQRRIMECEVKSS